MLPVDTGLIFKLLSNKVVTGAVALPHGAIGIVYDDGTVLSIAGDASLLSKEESAIALDWVSRSIARECASMRTLDALLAGNDPGARMTARREATVRDRDRSTTRSPVRTISDLDVPDFMQGPVLADEGVAPRSDVERRARTEQLARDIPEV